MKKTSGLGGCKRKSIRWIEWEQGQKNVYFQSVLLKGSFMTLQDQAEGGLSGLTKL